LRSANKVQGIAETFKRSRFGAHSQAVIMLMVAAAAPSSPEATTITVSALSEVLNVTREMASRASVMSTPAMLRSKITGYGNDLEARPNASSVSSGSRHGLRSLSPEEKMIYHRWRCGVLILYGAVVVVLGGLVFTGSFSPTSTALEKGAAHARLAAGSK
jgi:hypothetical protein